MIFVTLGSQKFQFNRLLKKIDELIDNEIVTDSVFAQTGASDYVPKHYSYKAFLDRDEFLCIMSKANIVITHGGTGAIINAVKQGKKVIAVPRLSKYGEHIDDHQLQLTKQFAEMNLIYVCDDINMLHKAIKEIKIHKYSIYQSNTEAIINSIENYINNLE